MGSTRLQSLGWFDEPSLTVRLLPLPEHLPTVISYTKRGDALIFKVHVVPRASRSEVVGEHNGALRVRIAAPPVDGAANEFVIHLLALAFKVSRTAVQITAGHSSKLKQVCITGASPKTLVALLQTQRK